MRRFALLIVLPFCLQLEAKKRAHSAWHITTDVSPVTDATEFYAIQGGSGGSMVIRCVHGNLNVLFTFDNLVFDPSRFGYRVDRQEPVFDPPDDSTAMRWIESNTSKAIGLWHENDARQFLDDLLAAKGKILYIELEYRDGRVRNQFFLDELPDVVKAVNTYCPPAGAPEAEAPVE
jgi:hypothetical protein